jgi:hypothetical protein
MMTTAIELLIIELRFHELTGARALLQAAIRRDALEAEQRRPEGDADASTG